MNIQLFYKHTDGSIRLREKGGFEWGEQSPQTTKPKDDSGLAAIGWSENGVRQVCTASITPPLFILILCFRYECIPRVETTLWWNLFGIAVATYGTIKKYPLAKGQLLSRREVT